ncbi:MAG: hypothetical protein PHN38_05210 [Sulfurospirillaceae bacterium]|nr:hypothetical protein [Sulfurospirillaceae bacterium]MDD3463206.1 hypothetical protein [Sulfurospirillaceae bacterium]
MVKKTAYGILILSIVALLGHAIYKEVTKEKCRSFRIPCHKEVVVFERIYDKSAMKSLEKALFKKSIHLALTTQKAQYSPSKLYDYIDLKEIKDGIYTLFGDENPKSELMLSVLIYENDPLDPGKKTQEAKKYAGYLVFGFHLNKELIYKVQVDFMDKEGKDIHKRVECAYESLLSIFEKAD